MSTKSCLNHGHHPALKADAILRGQNEMEQGDLDLLSLLFSVNSLTASPVTVVLGVSIVCELFLISLSVQHFLSYIQYLL